MIAINNYYQTIESQSIQRKNLPSALQKGWDYVNQVTKKGKDIEVYKSSEIVKRTINLYFEKLQAFLNTKRKPANEKKPAEPSVKTIADKKDIIISSKKFSTSSKTKAESPKAVVRKVNTSFVEKLSFEIRLIKRFLNLHEKAKTKNQIRLFLNYLQRAISEKEVRKTSQYADDVMEIQKRLINLLDRFGKEQIIQVVVPSKLRARYLSIIGKQTELQSVKFIKDYISLQGKAVSTAKAKKLHNRIGRKVNVGSLTDKDRYWNEIESIINNLKIFIKTNPIGGELKVESKTLNGLEGIVRGSNFSNSFNGPEITPKKENIIMNSMDIVNLSFEKLGFTGKWLDLIGNPSKDFTAMVYGKPKMGKSYLSVDFAGYLARNHGTVLYIAKEEGIDDTLQEKLKDTKVAHQDLFVSDFLPEDLSKFDFVFLDSVTKMGLSPNDLEDLKAQYPDKAFIYIFQSTKGGNFRGSNGFQHDVDVVIEVPEIGKAVQYGRFNQGGEMDIFSR